MLQKVGTCCLWVSFLYLCVAFDCFVLVILLLEFHYLILNVHFSVLATLPSTLGFVSPLSAHLSPDILGHAYLVHVLSDSCYLLIFILVIFPTVDSYQLLFVSIFSSLYL